MCERNPVREALAKVSLKQIESARDTALKRAAEADDNRTADLFRKVADEMSAELESRLLAIVTRDVLRESQETMRQMTELVTQMTS